jgi:hypothetical protein
VSKKKSCILNECRQYSCNISLFSLVARDFHRAFWWSDDRVLTCGLMGLGWCSKNVPKLSFWLVNITAWMLRLQVGNECLTLENHLWPDSIIPAKGSTWLQSKIIQLFQNFSHSHSKKLQSLLWPMELYFWSEICFWVPHLAIESVVLGCLHEFHVQVLFWLMKL